MGHEFESCATLNILKVKALKRWSQITGWLTEIASPVIWDQCCNCGILTAIVQVASHNGANYKARMSNLPEQDNNWSLIHWLLKSLISAMDLGSG